MQRKYIINLKNYGSMPNVVLSQYDDKYNLIFEVYDGNRPADLAGLTATLRGTRADGLKYSFTGAITGNVLTFAINTTLTGCAGSGIAELSITNVSGLNYGTYNFVVTIEKSPVPDDAIDADVTQAQSIQSQVQSIVNNAAATVRGEAEAWAIGERNGSAVPSSDETYHNNAKYYAEQARAAAASIGIDDTLTQSGKAADAKKTGNEISSLKEDLNAIVDYESLPSAGSSNGYRLHETSGFCYADTNYKIAKFRVIEGTTVKVVSDDKFQFQSASSVPTSGTTTKIGDVYSTGTFMIVVPTGANYLVMSTPVSGSIAEASKIIGVGDAITDISEVASGLWSVKDKVRTNNLFDKTDSRNTSGQYWTINGTLATGQSSNYYTSHPMYVVNGTYKFICATTFGANAPVVTVVDADGNYIKTIVGTNITTSVVSVEISEPCYVEINTIASYIKSLRFESADTWDDYLYSSGIPMDAARADDVTAVTDELLTFIASQKNLYDVNSAQNTSRQYWDKSGYAHTESSANYYTTHPILVSKGTYKFHAASTFGANKGCVAIVDTDKNLIQMINATVDSNDVATFTVDRACLVSFSTAQAIKNSVVFCRADLWDNEYHPYEKHINPSLFDFTGSVDKEDTTFWSWEKSANLLDLSEAISGKRFQVNGSNLGSLVDYTGKPVVSVYVPLDGAGTYVTKVLAGTYGIASNYLVLFDANKNYLAQITGTLDDPSARGTAEGITFTVTDEHIANGAKYLGLTLFTPTATNVMVVKSDTYPSEHIYYSEGWYQHDLTVGEGQAPAYTPNPLYHKTILFDGDSICSMSTDRAGKGSFAGRIATANHMNVRNYAVGGGSLTSGLYMSESNPRHWVSANVDTMYANYPDADYIIFEGGTNDADVIGSILNGNVPEKFGSVTPNDFSGSYDTETFCGAVETIIYKAVTYWSTKKTGFIIAPKMGTVAAKYNNRRAYFDKIIEICEKWGMPYIDLWNNCPINPNLLSCYDASLGVDGNISAHKMYMDGQHPTPTGYDRIYPIIEEWLRTL